MKLARSFLLSLLIHGSMVCAGVGFIAWEKAHSALVTEIDLKNSSLLLRPRSAIRPFSVAASEPWVLALEKGRQAKSVLPKPKPPVAPIADEEPAGTGTGTGPAQPEAPAWVSASSAAHIPEWAEGMITEDDYPRAARKQGREGRVVAKVVIDAEGKVTDVQITAGDDPEFAAVVLDRLKKARFKPGLDREGHPIAVRMSIPIVFELH